MSMNTLINGVLHNNYRYIHVHCTQIATKAIITVTMETSYDKALHHCTWMSKVIFAKNYHSDSVEKQNDLWVEKNLCEFSPQLLLAM